MKKKLFIFLIVLFILFILSIFIPVKTGIEWVNDYDMYDAGHTEKCYYNIYGGNLTALFKGLF